MTDATVRMRATIHGRVQGVGFRAFASHAGARLGIHGRVENRPDGTVESVVEGPRPAVDTMLSRLREGPPAARVERVDVVEDSSGEPLPPMTAGGWYR